MMSLFLLLGCQQNKKNEILNSYSIQEAEINQLKIQLSDLERRIKSKNKSKSKSGLKINIESSPIKSITFRIGTKDDRVRIYWEDGRKTDLPCTKEQKIWACG